MSRVLTNKTGLSFAIETSTPGVLSGSPTWFKLEPNAINELGAKIKTVPRRPISRTRQLKKGTTVDLDSAVSYDCDLTMDVATKEFEGLVFAEFVNANLYFFAPVASGTGWTIPGATTSQAAKLQWNNAGAGAKSLVFAAGYAIAANNGLKVLTADTGLAATTITVSGNSVETPPTNAFVTIAGVRAITGDLKIDVGTPVSGQATITAGQNGVVAANQVDFTTLGITKGQFVHVGGLAAGQQFSAGLGFARVIGMTAGPGSTLVLDKLDARLVTDNGAGDTVDILFGRFLRDVSNDQNVDDSRYIERTKTFELAEPDLGSPGVDGYEYPFANYLNELTLDMPETNKITAKLGYLGFDTPVPTGSRKTNASTAISPIGTTAFNTTSSFVNLRTDGLSSTNTFFKSLTLKITNNLSPDKILSVLGAAVMDVGQFICELTATMIYADSSVPTHIRANDTQTFDFMLKNGDGGIAFDFPSVTFGDGAKSFPLDKSVKIAVTFMPFGDATLGNSIGISLFPVLP